MAVEVQKPRIEAYWIMVEEKMGAHLVAHKLDNAPEDFFVLDNPDPYVLKALTNLGSPVNVNSHQNTSIRQMVDAYNTRNLQFNGSYYGLSFLYADPAPPPYSFTEFYPFLLTGWTLLGTSILITLAIRKVKSRNMVQHDKESEL